MKVILLQDIKGVGKKDDVINANDGYVRNYLFPKKLAEEATKGNLAKLKSKQDSVQRKKDIEKEDAKKVAKQLENIILEIKVKAGENGKIFGGVTWKEITEELNKKYKIDVDKKKVNIKESIKNLGTVTVEIKLYEGIIGKLKVKVIAE